MLVSSKTNNATPLVMACRYGHYDVAKYLIEECTADIEQPGAGERRFWFYFFLVRVETGFLLTNKD
jgi:Ankyrin repeat